MDSLLENELLTKNLNLENTKKLLKNTKLIGLYFSGHYCPPCKKFTPILAEVYDEIKNNNTKDIEIIFISSDKEKESFNKYYNDMPWLALPYEKRNIKQQLCEKFNIKTIPALIFFNYNGELIEREGKKFIENNILNIDNIVKTLLHN
jgi:nucleoredoxin